MAIAIPLGSIVILFVGIRIWSFVVGRTSKPNADGIVRRQRRTSDYSGGSGWDGHHAIGCESYDAGDGGGGD
jgi:hypothetical protein